MLIPGVALAVLLATRGTIPSVPPPAPPPAALTPVIPWSSTEIADSVRKQFESIAGPGSVDVSVVNETLFSIRIAVPSFRSEICTPIYEREIRLYRLFPGLNFDFYLRLKPGSSEQGSR